MISGSINAGTNSERAEFVREDNPTVLNVTASGNNRIKFEPSEEASTTFLWETLIQVDHSINVFDSKLDPDSKVTLTPKPELLKIDPDSKVTPKPPELAQRVHVTNSILTPEPQRVYVYEMILEGGSQWNVKLSLEQQIETNSEAWLMDRSPKDADDVLNFVHQDNATVSFDTVIENLGIEVLQDYSFLPATVMKTLDLQQNRNEPNDAYRERLLIGLPPLRAKGDKESEKAYDKRKLDHEQTKQPYISDKKKKAVEAIKKDDWDNVFESLLKKQEYILQRDQVNVVLSLQASGKDPVEDIKPLNLEAPKNANWEPVKMRLTERMVTVTIPASDITLEVLVPVQENASPIGLFKMGDATLGGNYDTQDSTKLDRTVDIFSTFDVFMSESRIWKDGETPLKDLEF